MKSALVLCKNLFKKRKVKEKKRDVSKKLVAKSFVLSTYYIEYFPNLWVV